MDFKKAMVSMVTASIILAAIALLVFAIATGKLGQPLLHPPNIGGP